MDRNARALIIATGMVIGLGGCGGSGSSTASSSPTAPTPPPSPSPPAGLACGSYRWFVKTLADADAASVNIRNVTPTSIRNLNDFADHCAEAPERRVYPEEFKVFEVVGRITYAAHNSDRDYHIALEDPASPGSTVITELADAMCVGAVLSPDFATLRTADAMFETLLAGREPSALVGTTVRVRGVGFYDFAHPPQIGRSKSCIELHPILFIDEAR
jgi:hypothetical protein